MSRTQLSLELYQKLLSSFEEIPLQTLSKGDQLCFDKDHILQLIHVYNGAVAIYPKHIDEIFRLAYTGDIILDVGKYCGAEIHFECVALRETQCKSISLEDFLLSLGNQRAETEVIFLKQMLAEQFQREKVLKLKTAQEKISAVLKNSPKIFQEVPLKYIAGYLNLSPETLSRSLNS